LNIYHHISIVGQVTSNKHHWGALGKGTLNQKIKLPALSFPYLSITFGEAVRHGVGAGLRNVQCWRPKKKVALVFPERMCMAHRNLHTTGLNSKDQRDNWRIKNLQLSRTRRKKWHFQGFLEFLEYTWHFFGTVTHNWTTKKKLAPQTMGWYGDTCTLYSLLKSSVNESTGVQPWAVYALTFCVNVNSFMVSRG